MINCCINNLIIASLLLALIVYLIFHNIGFKNFFKKNKQANKLKYGFYESGYKTKCSTAVEVTLSNFLVLSITIIYDVECIFFIILVLNINNFIIIDFFLAFFYIFLFFIGFFFDFKNKSIN